MEDLDTCQTLVLHEAPSPLLQESWKQLLAGVPMPSHYTLPEFFLEPYFAGKAPFAILAVAPAGVRGVLTGVHEGNTITCGLPTRPQAQLSPEATAETVVALRAGLEREAGNAPLISIFSWAGGLWDELAGAGYRKREVGAIPVLDLSLGPDALLKLCDKKRRNSIRFGMKSGLEVAPASSSEDYDAFYEIYKGWCGAKGLHCYSREVEQEAFTQAGGNRILFVARHEGKVIAGSVFRFAPGGMVDYSRNCSLPEYQNLKPNDVLVWRAVEWACANGFQKMSMGGSHRFLREFGGTMMPVYRYRKDRTLLRRNDGKEWLMEKGGAVVRRLPPSLEKTLRKMLGKEKQPGW